MYNSEGLFMTDFLEVIREQH